LNGNFQREFIIAGGRRIARRDISGGAAHYYLTDRLGSSSVVASASGVIENESGYLPYGTERVYTQNLANQNYKFTGKERDSESGLDDFGARFDSSNLGRFMTPDWSAVPVDVPYAQMANPQSLNLYAYVMNSPVTSADLDGHQDDRAQRITQCNAKAEGDKANERAEAAAGGSAFLQYVKAEAAGTVEYGKKVFDALSVLPYVGPFFGAGSASVSASQGKTGEAATSLALAAIPAGGDLKASGRALELAGTMGKTADFVTIAVTKTAEGVDVVSSSEKAVRPVVQAALQPGEVAVKGAAGVHAEVSGVNGARQMGLTPTGVEASRGICSSCADFLKGAGVATLSALRQIF
jgi:RHS repeat-associated protein